MRLWRLSGKQHADAFNGGYGLLFDGRWNTVGHAVTYCATSPALCVLEKLVHVEDPTLLPDLVMVTYEVSGAVSIETIALEELPKEWRRQEGWTQQRGDAWHESRSALLLRVPSVIVPLKDSPDANVLINHNHPEVADVEIASVEPFTLDARLF